MNSANDEPTPEQRIEYLNNYIHELEQRIEYLNNYIHELETAAAADRKELLEANRIIEVRTNTLKEIAASLQAERVDLIEEKINDIKNKVAWINDYKEAFNNLGMLIASKSNDIKLDPIYDDDGNPSYIPDDIIDAVGELLKANAPQSSSSGMSSQMFKL